METGPLWREKNFFHVNYFGFIIFLIFTPYIAIHNIASKTMQDLDLGNAGFYSLAALYLSASITCFFTSQIIEALGAKRTMLLNIGFRMMWQLSFVPAAYRHHLVSNSDGNEVEVESPLLSVTFLSVL